MALPAIPLVEHLQVISFALETTATETLTGTPASASVINCYVSNFRTSIDDFLTERRGHGLSGHNIPGFPGEKVGTIEFETIVGYNDSNYTMLQACGFKETASNTLKHVTDWANHRWATLYHNVGTRRYALAGAFGDVTLSFQMGVGLRAAYRFMGTWQSVSTAALPAYTMPVALTRQQPTSSVQYAGAAVPHFSRCVMTVNNALFMRPAVTRSQGVAHAAQGIPTISLDFDFDAHVLGDFDYWTNFQAGTAASMVVPFTDGTNTITFTAAKAQIVSSTPGARNSIHTDNVRMIATSNSVDNDAFTYVQA